MQSQLMHAFSVVEDGRARISQIRFLGGKIILDIAVVYSLSNSLNPQYISISVALKIHARGRLGKKCPPSMAFEEKDGNNKKVGKNGADRQSSS